MSSRLARAFSRSPLARVALLAGTVLATVATSPSYWHIEQQAPLRTVSLQPGTSLTRAFSVQGSHSGPTLLAHADVGPKASTPFRVDVTAEDAACVGASSSFEKSGDAWWETREADGTDAGTAQSPRSVHSPFVGGSCSDNASHRFRVVVTNVGTAPLELTSRVEAFVNEDGPTDPPDDAFVRLVEEEP